MNHDELAALLALTHGSMTPASKSMPVHSGLKMSKPAEMACVRDPRSRLSPRQQLQSRVRVLVGDGQVTPVSGPSTTGKSGEVQQLSGRRLHVRSTGSPGRRKPTDNARIPDFVVEERAAWNESPHEQAQGRIGVSRPEPSGQKSASPSASRPGQQWQPPFGPASTPRDSNKKAKANRGPKTDVPVNFPKSSSEKDMMDMHKTRFNEGSMSERSAAVSSTWERLGPRLSESSDTNAGDRDADSTFWASRMSRDTRGSFDVSEFQLVPTTPSTIKKTFTKLGSHFKSATEDSQPANEPKQTKRRGLRKSLSNWNLHLGEKMHFFGGSTHDLGNPRSATPVKKQTVAETELLDDRKRKADVAYAEQFGTKKQKGNDGQPTSPEAVGAVSPAQSRSIKRQSSSAQPMSTPSTTRRRQASPSCPTHQNLDRAEILSGGDVDRRKRPTRRELEKENQQLRAMLRERDEKQCGSISSESKSAASQLPEDQRALSMPQASTPATATPRAAAAAVATRRQHKQRPGQDVPPVPPLPSRTVLATLAVGNNALSRISGTGSKPATVDLATTKRASGEMPRSISTIMEDDENAPVGENISSLEFGILPGLNPSPKEDKWQWPDDVF
ncbi:hypothetical protein DV736_g340, partial [Chaetothyriales sp. CBS 134916]